MMLTPRFMCAAVTQAWPERVCAVAGVAKASAAIAANRLAMRIGNPLYLDSVVGS
jgi:hypothetical protein